MIIFLNTLIFLKLNLISLQLTIGDLAKLIHLYNSLKLQNAAIKSVKIFRLTTHTKRTNRNVIFL